MADLKKAFTLGDLIKSTAEELKSARSPKPEDAVMQFEKCELELAVSIGGEAKTGIRFWLMEASAEVKGETVSKVKLSFGPVSGQSNVFMANKPGGKGTPFKKPKSKG